MSSDVISLLQRLIQNECVNTGSIDSGHEHRSVATLQEFFGEKGEVFEPAPGCQSVVYKVPGTDPDAPSLALVPHLDVVPVEPAGWVHDPFGGAMVDGFIYGRGAVDMLNITAAFAIGARPYVRGELAPRGTSSLPLWPMRRPEASTAHTNWSRTGGISWGPNTSSLRLPIHRYCLVPKNRYLSPLRRKAVISRG